MELIKTEKDVKWLKHPSWIWMQFGMSKTWIKFWLWFWYEFWIWGLYFSSTSLCTFHFHPDVKKMCVDLRWQMVRIRPKDEFLFLIQVIDPQFISSLMFKENYICICLFINYIKFSDLDIQQLKNKCVDSNQTCLRVRLHTWDTKGVIREPNLAIALQIPNAMALVCVGKTYGWEARTLWPEKQSVTLMKWSGLQTYLRGVNKCNLESDKDEGSGNEDNSCKSCPAWTQKETQGIWHQCGCSNVMLLK